MFLQRYTSQINRVRDELNRLREEKENYQKQRQEAEVADQSENGEDANNDVGQLINHEQILEYLKEKSKEEDRILCGRVGDYNLHFA